MSKNKRLAFSSKGVANLQVSCLQNRINAFGHIRICKGLGVLAIAVTLEVGPTSWKKILLTDTSKKNIVLQQMWQEINLTDFLIQGVSVHKSAIYQQNRPISSSNAALAARASRRAIKATILGERPTRWSSRKKSTKNKNFRFFRFIPRKSLFSCYQYQM